MAEVDERSPLTNHVYDHDNRINATRRDTRKFLSSKWGHYIVLVLVGLDVSSIFADFIVQIFTCEGKIPKDDGETTLEVLSIVSLIFSCLFVLELLARVWAFGLNYFRSKFHCFDAMIILTSFVIDVLLRGILEEVASIVIVLRLWRVFKIIEELSVSAEDQMEELQLRLEAAEQEQAQMEAELSRLKTQYGHHE